MRGLIFTNNHFWTYQVPNKGSKQHILSKNRKTKFYSFGVHCLSQKNQIFDRRGRMFHIKSTRYLCLMCLTHFRSMFHFCSTWKQKTKGFLIFSGRYRNGTLAWNGLKLISKTHSWQRVPNPLFYEDPLYCLPPIPPPFSNFVQPSLSALFVALFLCFHVTANVLFCLMML